MVNDQKEEKDVKNPVENEKPEVEEKTDVKQEISKEEIVDVEVKEEEKKEEPLKVEEKEEIETVPEIVSEEEKTEVKQEVPKEEVIDVEVKEEEKKEIETASETVSMEEETEEEAVIPVEGKEEKEPEKKVKSDSEDDDFTSLLNEHFSKFEKGKIVEGVVVSVDERSVLIDIGFKSESAISIKEFSTSQIPDPGTRINVFIESVEDRSGRLKLSKKKADFYLNLEHLKKIQESNGSVTGLLKRRVKGGMIAEIENLEAFLPGSQIALKPIPNLDQFIGKESEFKILKIDEERRNIIVSRRKVLEEQQEKKLGELKNRLSQGAELDGEVRNITDYGAFIDLGGIDGLLHITDMSWGHIKHPSDMLNIGDKVKVKVLDFDEDTEKVSLGLKQLVPHPWENIEVKYPEGTIVSGKVVNITNYGVFVELESGVEGLVHISEMSWTKKIKHPKQMLKLGDNIKAIVLSTSKEERRISLGLKQMEANPWLTIEERYPINTELKGIVNSITPFGVFVEIEEDIEGLIHISDISWTKRIYHPKEAFKKSQEVFVKVLSIDKTLHRIALGVKQLSADPWKNLDEKLPINSEVIAKIVKIISKGVLVDVEQDGLIVEGFVPLSHLAIPGLKKAGMAFEVEEELPLKIIELDLENRRLILSVKAYFFARDSTELKDFVDTHQSRVFEKEEKRRAIKENLAKVEKEIAPEPEIVENLVEKEKKETETAETDSGVEIEESDKDEKSEVEEKEETPEADTEDKTDTDKGDEEPETEEAEPVKETEIVEDLVEEQKETETTETDSGVEIEESGKDGEPEVEEKEEAPEIDTEDKTDPDKGDEEPETKETEPVKEPEIKEEEVSESQTEDESEKK